MKIQVSELERMGYDSVTDYCRYLMEVWDYPCPWTPDEPIEVYRGEVLVLTGSSIRYCSTIEPNDVGFRKYRKHRRKGVAEAH
jgi:hypothetical protein